MSEQQPHDKAYALQLTMEKMPDGRVAVQRVSQGEVQPVEYFDDICGASEAAQAWLKETRQ